VIMSNLITAKVAFLRWGTDVSGLQMQVRMIDTGGKDCQGTYLSFVLCPLYFAVGPLFFNCLILPTRQRTKHEAQSTTLATDY
jgi:hypothetical protein